MRIHYSKGMPTWLKVLLWILGIGAIFCLVVLIYGSCTGQTFVEVLVDDWFGFLNNSQPEKVEEVSQSASSLLSLIVRR